MRSLRNILNPTFEEEKERVDRATEAFLTEINVIAKLCQAQQPPHEIEGAGMGTIGPALRWLLEMNRALAKRVAELEMKCS